MRYKYLEGEGVGQDEPVVVRELGLALDGVAWKLRYTCTINAP